MKNLKRTIGAALSRRKFIGSVVGVVVATPLLLETYNPSPPLPWYHQEYRGELTATQFITKSYNHYTKGSNWPGDIQMYASPTLYDAYEGELVCLQRFVDNDPYVGYKRLVYKTASVYRTESFPKGWHLGFMSGNKKDGFGGAYYDLSYWQS